MGRKLSRTTPSHHPRHAPSTPQTPPLHFLALPGEIRNRIYHHTLAQHFDHSTTLTLLSDISDPAVFRPSPQQPPLARTSRQLRHEVLALFLGARTFDLDRELGARQLIDTWTRILRPALWYLRSVRFELFSEFTAAAKDLEAGACDVVAVSAWVTEERAIGFRVESGETCACKFARCARDVERGVLGSPGDAPLIRFLMAWDLPAPPVRGDRYMVCHGCGGGNLQVSLRDIRRRPSVPA